VKRAASLSLLYFALVACADGKPLADEAQLDAVPVDEAKADSLSRPTLRGDIAIGDSLEGDLLGRDSAFHAYDFHAAASLRVRFDATGAAPADLFLIAYRKRLSGSWERIGWNDDCTFSTRNACLELDAVTGSEYRVVVSTFQAVVLGVYLDVNYSLSAVCADAFSRPAK